METFIFFIGNIFVNIVSIFLVYISKEFIGKFHHLFSKCFMTFAGSILPVLNICIFISCIILNFTQYKYLIQYFNIYNIYLISFYVSFYLSCIIFLFSIINDMLLYLSLYIHIVHIIYKSKLKWFIPIIFSILVLLMAEGILYLINHILSLKTIIGYINEYHKRTALIILGGSLIQIIINNFKSDNDSNVYTKLYKSLMKIKINYFNKNICLKLIRTINIDDKISTLFTMIGLFFATYSFILILCGTKYWKRINKEEFSHFDYKILMIGLCSLIVDFILIQIVNLIMSYIYYHPNKNNDLFQSIENTTVFTYKQIIRFYDELFIALMYIYNIYLYFNSKLNYFLKYNSGI